MQKQQNKQYGERLIHHTGKTNLLEMDSDILNLTKIWSALIKSRNPVQNILATEYNNMREINI